MPDHQGLLIALQAAVPLNILLMRDWTPQQRANEAAWIRNLDVLGPQGDLLMYRGHESGRSGATFNALAKALALLAHQPGGVDFAGLHWCVDTHELCACREAS